MPDVALLLRGSFRVAQRPDFDVAAFGAGRVILQADVALHRWFVKVLHVLEFALGNEGVPIVAS